MERIYHKVLSAGALSLACGIVAIVAGVSTGVLLIISGGKLLAAKKDMDI